MVDAVFEDGPLKGRRLRDSQLTDRWFLTTRDGEHMYCKSHQTHGTLPQSGTRVLLEVVYRHVPDAQIKEDRR